MPLPNSKSADALVSRLTALPSDSRLCLLDSCGVGHLGSHLLIAGIDPVETISLSVPPADSLREIQKQIDRGFAAVFTIAYDLGMKLHNIRSRNKPIGEPDIYIALFDSLIVHDYASGNTFTNGRKRREHLYSTLPVREPANVGKQREMHRSNLSRSQYLEAVEVIKEHIRRGNTYQTNLTQKLSVPLLENDRPGEIFMRLRRDHPAPFAAFLDRGESQVVSASPERFFKIEGRKIKTSPIKGTRRRGSNRLEDERLRRELLSSEKDRAENTMIVDLLRNDLGIVCEYGSVAVTKLCDLEEHPTLFHLVSTVEGRLRDDVEFVDAVNALFPCGSITGAPKIRTMQLIDELEPDGRGLSMGAIGYYVPEIGFDGLKPGFDLSVAIRTMTIRDRTATFNVGGGITIDSEPEAEYAESLLKAKALLAALGNK